MTSKNPYLLKSILLFFTGPSLHAQVVLDGTLGKSGALPGPDYQVEANLGSQHGSNLFHSFQDFNLQSHESATFSGPPNVTNVISRVTGGNPSQIDGTIRSTIPNADMYFLNHSGILFGANAKLDVQGGFHASTADYLRLGDGGRFEARTPGNSLLTVAPVAAFGFLTPTPARITLQDSRLSVPERKTLSFIGGELSLTGQLVFDDTGKQQFNVFKHPLTPLSIPVYTSQLTAPAGQINLASVATSGEMRWIDSHLDLTSSLSGGSIYLDQTDLNVNGPGGGNIFIRAGLLKLTNSHLESQTLGDQDGGVIDVGADNFLMRGGEHYAGIHANSWGPGTGSTIRLQARQMDFANGVFITANTFQLGNPGNIRILVAERLNFEGQYLPELKLPSGIFSSVLSLQPNLDQANPSTMEIEAGSLNLLKGAEIGSITFGVKDSANIYLQIHEDVTIAGEIREDDNAFGDSSFTFPSGVISNSYMGSQTLASFGINYPNAGNGGHLHIQAGRVSMSDNGLISSEARTGNSGDIEINSQQLSVTDGSTISTSVIGTGQGGKLQIKVTDQIRLSGTGSNASSLDKRDETYRPTGLQAAAFTSRIGIDGGKGGTIEVEAGHLVIEDLAQINVISATDGNAGHLYVRADKLEIRTGIVASSTLKGKGDGGEISIQAHDIKLSEAGLINSSGFSPTGGKAGNILLETDSLTLLSGGNISVSTVGAGPPGRIQVKVSGNLLIAGHAGEKRSFVNQVVGQHFSSALVTPIDLIGASKIDAAVIAQGTESAGTIEIEAKHLEIRDGAEITSAHDGMGDAGDILIKADEIHLKGGALTTETKGGGGGNIEIHLPDLLYLVEGKITTSVGTGKGRGGDVTIDLPQFTVLNHSQIKAQADEGHGGNIHITANQFVASSDSLISASAKRGIDGQVVISAPNENISSGLLGLTSQLKEVVMLKQPCGAMSFEEFLQRGHFYVFRIAGSPQTPEDWHPSPYLSVRDWQSPPVVKSPEPLPKPSYGEQERKEQGGLVLMVECQKGK